jgi:hypothetical protein
MVNVIVFWQTVCTPAARDHLAASGYPPGPGCTTAQIKTVIKNIRVRFSDQSLWSASTAVSSAIVPGSSNPACLA